MALDVKRNSAIDIYAIVFMTGNLVKGCQTFHFLVPTQLVLINLNVVVILIPGDIQTARRCRRPAAVASAPGSSGNGNDKGNDKGISLLLFYHFSLY